MAQRVDSALYSAGLAQSRTHARRIIEEGRARINGKTVTKPSLSVSSSDVLTVEDVPEGGEYVSRGAHKLTGVLGLLGSKAPAIQDARIVDIGASTGGFTDVCLRHEAASVVAVDVGHGQLHPRLMEDPRVENREGTDARDLTRTLVGQVDGFVSDVSFISLTKLLPTLAALADDHTWALLMVKPQFEVGKEKLPKTGVVSDPHEWKRAVMTVAECAAAEGFSLEGMAPSPLPGQDGNVEFFLLLRYTSRKSPMSLIEYGMIEYGLKNISPAFATPRKGEGT